MIGIAGYGAYVPRCRLTVKTIAQAWSQDASKIINSLGVESKAVVASDEDAATIAIQAAQHAIARAAIDVREIGAVYVGSESHPYVVKPTATIVGTALGLSGSYYAADIEFACKGGTSALQVVMGLVASGMVHYGLAVGADVAQATPGDVLEYTASAGGGAYVISRNPSELVAVIDDTLSVSSDTPDFWRREVQRYPEHTGRFTGQPAYCAHVDTAARAIMDRNCLTAGDFDYAVFHQPNGKFPVLAAQKLGFTSKQWRLGLLAPVIGNCYSASTLVGLAAILDQAQAGQRLLVVSYGGGAGSDAFILTTTELLAVRRAVAPLVQAYIVAGREGAYAVSPANRSDI